MAAYEARMFSEMLLKGAVNIVEVCGIYLLLSRSLVYAQVSIGLTCFEIG